MTTEEKAKEIGKRCGMKYEDDQFNVVADSSQECISAALEMGKWKDEEIRMIVENIKDKIIYLKKNPSEYSSMGINSLAGYLLACDDIIFAINNMKLI